MTEKKNMRLLALSLALTFLCSSSFAQSCQEIENSIDEINSLQLVRQMEEGTLLREELAEFTLNFQSALLLKSMREDFSPDWDFSLAFAEMTNQARLDEDDLIFELLKTISPECDDIQGDLQRCGRALKPLLANGVRQERLESEAFRIGEKIKDFGRYNPVMKSLSVVKIKLAQDFQRANCSVTDENRDKFNFVCSGLNHFGRDNHGALEEHIRHNMDVVQFMAFQERQVDGEQLARACGDLAQAGVSTSACAQVFSGGAAVVRTCDAGFVSVGDRCLTKCMKRFHYRNQAGSCVLNEQAQDEFKKERRKERWNKVGKFAGYAALAGGAVAVSAWGVSKLGGDIPSVGSSYSSSGSGGSSGRLVPASHRSSYLYPQKFNSFNQNTNFSHYYGYPYSWNAPSSFESPSPYSIENYNPGTGVGSQNSGENFSFGF